MNMLPLAVAASAGLAWSIYANKKGYSIGNQLIVSFALGVLVAIIFGIAERL